MEADDVLVRLLCYIYVASLLLPAQLHYCAMGICCFGNRVGLEFWKLICDDAIDEYDEMTRHLPNRCGGTKLYRYLEPGAYIHTARNTINPQ